MKKGTLWLIPVPLGAMDDVTTIPDYVQARVQTLQYFVVERSKTARSFIKKVAPKTVQAAIFVEELNDQTPDTAISELAKPLRDGHDVGLISEAGCPAVADPGAKLVGWAHQNGVQVVPLVGPSSILLALMGSGLNGQNFAFVGYVSAKKGETEADLKRLESTMKKTAQTQIFIETPYRNHQIIDAMIQHLHPETKLCIGVDLSLPNEFLLTKKISDWKKVFQQPNPPNFHKRTAIFLIGN